MVFLFKLTSMQIFSKTNFYKKHIPDIVMDMLLVKFFSIFFVSFSFIFYPTIGSTRATYINHMMNFIRGYLTKVHFLRLYINVWILHRERDRGWFLSEPRLFGQTQATHRLLFPNNHFHMWLKHFLQPVSGVSQTLSRRVWLYLG